MNLFNQHIQTQNEQINFSVIKEKEVELWIKREDKIHELVSGNKFRKLKYNILEAEKQQKNTVLTFGGAYSNHIVATAVACKLSGLQSIGVIRGDELKYKANLLQENQTLRIAHENGMKFEFVSREDYRKKTEEDFINKLRAKFGNFYYVGEGGTNKFAIKGCEEILTEEDQQFDYICSAVGTGGTISGLINSAKNHQKIIGFPALKGDFLAKEIKKWTHNNNNTWSLNTNYHFGGYAKYNEELIRFINQFKQQTQIPLDPVYTGKMLFGIINLISNNFFPKQTKILAIHTGGLQGITGINKKLQQKQLKQIIS